LAAVFDSWYISIVNFVGKIVICLASGLAFNASLHADSVVLPGNPYAPVVARNIFGLNPPQPIAPVDASPPPKITANGIMTIFGSRQALFKVASTAKPGQPGKDNSYILSEGQRQDDIEVTRIDEKAGIITFNNHGTVQQIPLTTAPTLTAPATFAANPNPAPAMFAPMNTGNNNNVAGGNLGGRFGRNRGGNFNGAYGGSPNNTSTYGNSNMRSVPAQPQIDPETQQALIVAQHLQAQQTGDPMSRIFPPTDLDAAAGIAPEGGSPAPP
jgi:hypothetical protein